MAAAIRGVGPRLSVLEYLPSSPGPQLAQCTATPHLLQPGAALQRSLFQERAGDVAKRTVIMYYRESDTDE
jgi:hypothetical protein